MSPSLLSWGAQIAHHAAFVEHREAERKAVAPAGPGRGRGNRVRGQTDHGATHREALLHALRDGKPHRFADLRAALPGHSAQGIYYLVRALEAEGRIKTAPLNRTNRSYRLT